MKYAMPYDWCRQMGRELAVAGYSREQVIAYMVAGNCKANGLSTQMVLRAWERQVAAG